MENPTKKHHFFASCPRDMEDLLMKELEIYPVEGVKRSLGGIYFDAHAEVMIDFMFSSRIASRTFREITSFFIKNEDDIYKKGREQWWNKIFHLHQTFKIQTLLDRAAKDRFNNSMILSLKLKDAIVDQFREYHDNERPSVNTEEPDVKFLMRIEQGKFNDFRVTIYQDLCGAPLSDRGYREAGHSAPLRENLAAAIAMTTEFDPSKEIFMDSMCGTGTILIEAIMLAYNISPQYLKIRRIVEKSRWMFDLQKSKWLEENPLVKEYFDKRVTEVYNDTLKKLNEIPANQFFGFDNSFSSLEVCKRNLRNALMFDIVELAQKDATTMLSPENPPGVVVCNPPYGERLVVEDLEKLYYEYGENLKQNFKGFRAYIFCPQGADYGDLRKHIHLQTKQRTPFFNGNIECRLLRYNLY